MVAFCNDDSLMTLCLKIVCSIVSRGKIRLQREAADVFLREEPRQGEAIARYDLSTAYSEILRSAKISDRDFGGATGVFLSRYRRILMSLFLASKSANYTCSVGIEFLIISEVIGTGVIKCSLIRELAFTPSRARIASTRVACSALF